MKNVLVGVASILGVTALVCFLIAIWTYSPDGLLYAQWTWTGVVLGAVAFVSAFIAADS